MEIAQGFFGIGVLGICYGLYKVANGRLSKKVNKDACHIAQGAIRRRIDDLEKHVDDRFDLLGKDIERLYNGKK